MVAHSKSIQPGARNGASVAVAYTSADIFRHGPQACRQAFERSASGLGIMHDHHPRRQAGALLPRSRHNDDRSVVDALPHQPDNSLKQVFVSERQPGLWPPHPSSLAAAENKSTNVSINLKNEKVAPPPRNPRARPGDQPTRISPGKPISRRLVLGYDQRAGGFRSGSRVGSRPRTRARDAGVLRYL